MCVGVIAAARRVSVSFDVILGEFEWYSVTFFWLNGL